MATTAAVSEPTPTPAAPKRGKGLIFVVLGVVLLAAGAGGGFFYFKSKARPDAATAEHAAEPKGEPVYVSLEPAMVVNLEGADASRFMQVEAQVVVYDPHVAEQIKLHLPLIRNRLLLLFSGQHYDQLYSRAAKEKLQAAALEEVRKVMQEQTGKPGVEALYFTSLVMQ